jgi:hypothetical protein
MHRIFHVTDLLTAMDFLDWGNGIWGSDLYKYKKISILKNKEEGKNR